MAVIRPPPQVAGITLRLTALLAWPVIGGKRWLSGRLRQSLCLEGFLHFRPGSDAIHISRNVRPFRSINVDPRRPSQHCEHVGIGDRELVAHQVLSSGEFLVDPVKALAEVFPRDGLVGIGRGRSEQRAEALVQLRRDEVEPLLDPVALHGAGSPGEAGRVFLIGHVLHDDRAFGESLAVVEFETRHLALRVHGPIVLAGLGFLFLIVHLLKLEICAGLTQHDVRRQRAGPWRKIELHIEDLPEELDYFNGARKIARRRLERITNLVIGRLHRLQRQECRSGRLPARGAQSAPIRPLPCPLRTWGRPTGSVPRRCAGAMVPSRKGRESNHWAKAPDGSMPDIRPRLQTQPPLAGAGCGLPTTVTSMLPSSRRLATRLTSAKVTALTRSLRLSM